MSHRRSNQRYQSGRRPQSDQRYQREYTKQKKRRGGFKPGILLIVLVVLIAAVAAFLILRTKEEAPEEEKPRLASPAIASSVTVGSTGDILIHSPIYDAAATGDGNYDFSRDFALVAPYYTAPDIMVANLEVTCAGEENGYKSYPLFNCPDEIVTALANSGVDICLTANNHANDSGTYGIKRTLDVIKENGMQYTGTRQSTDEHYIVTKMVN